MRVAQAVNWVSVESSVFTAAAYRRDERQMYLRFHSGDIYRYFEFPQQMYNEFLVADSKGRYFSRNIRHRYRYEQVHRHVAGSAV